MTEPLTQPRTTALTTEPVPACLICGASGVLLHAELRDWTFGAPGVWRMVECRDCGLAWLDPRLTPQDIGKAYETYYTHERQQRGTIFRTVVPLASVVERSRQRIAGYFTDVAQQIRARKLGHPAAATSLGVTLLGRVAERVPSIRDSAVLTVASLPPGGGRRLLDVGCGSGEFLDRMRAAGWNVVGVEPDPVAADAARSRSLDVRDGALPDAGFDAESFDAVVLSHVIEHVHDPLALLQECARVLRPAGVLVLMTPNLESAGHRRFGADWRGLEPPRHLYVFSTRSLSTCVQRVGLRLDEVRTSARWVRGIWWVSRVIQHQAGTRRRGPGLVGYVESWAMSIVEDLLRIGDPLSSEEIILIASKPATGPAQP